MNDVPQCSPKQLPSEQSLSKEKQNITDGILHELGRLVNFGDVTVYEFELWLGDNPAVRDGCPVMLGKHCTDCYKVDINTFEAERASRRRHGKDLYIPVPDRTAL